MTDKQGYPPPTQGYPQTQGQQPPPYPADQAAYPPPQAVPYPGAYPQGQQQPAYPQGQQQPAYPQGQQQPPPPQQASAVTTVITTQPTVVQNVRFREYPVVVTTADGRQVQTRIEYRSGILNWLICCAIFWIVFWIFPLFSIFAVIAFCINDLKDVYHFDDQGNLVGVYKRLS